MAPRGSYEPARSTPAIQVEVALGTNTPSNFYRSLAGEDIVDHGGLFIATYAAPDVGQRVALRLSLPGGYEFRAQGVVRWRRVGLGGSPSPEAPPGYGVELREVSPQARQLIQRYAKNRDPLLHD
jgi:uncharacterized protein (TIGR02266 family)